MIEPATAQLLRHVQRIQTQGFGFFMNRLGINRLQNTRLFHLLLKWLQLLAHKARNRLGQEPLFMRERKVHF
jgi:hypothetical protein